jgi:hypothetical protein
MLSRFITETIRDSGGDGRLVTTTASSGVGASRIRPSTRIPCDSSAARNAPAVKRAGSPTVTRYFEGGVRAPIVPLTRIWSSPTGRAEIRTPVPATVRTVLVTVIPCAAGSIATLAMPPTAPGATATIAMLSLSESALKGAA